MLGCQEKRKERKIQKSRSEVNVVGFRSASLFPARKWEAVTQAGNHEDRPPSAEDNQGSWYRQRIGEQVRLRVLFRYIHVQEE